ncbi:MAG: NAD(+)--dinitrogen-reductase ADP-D-ribosyltransferase [Rhodocyclaceae bacterium]|nr:NAD(+)--dinitrogen-reductase ADP-D-ribosyltransferase [Rhodocyclaceae bacterium]
MEADNFLAVCRTSDKPSLPAYARLPINRCNLPAVILGGLTYQDHPARLQLDGVADLHRALFVHLDAVPEAAARGRLFRDYMAAHFCLDQLEEAGFDPALGRRGRANWLRLLRGWGFAADGLEGAALKAWVESRFGLPPRFHGQPLRDYDGQPWRRYEEMRARALYGTNALEAQLDVLYAYCQYEFERAGAATNGVVLYRGVNRIEDHEVLADSEAEQVVLFNNLASFSGSRERAGEFGDRILEVRVPLPKILCHYRLLPGLLQSEEEYLVIGGVYRVTRAPF